MATGSEQPRSPGRQRPWLRRWSWNPIVVGILLAYFVTRVATAGFTSMRTIGLCGVGLWFALAVIDRLTRHRFTDWVYSNDDRDEPHDGG